MYILCEIHERPYRIENVRFCHSVKSLIKYFVDENIIHNDDPITFDEIYRNDLYSGFDISVIDTDTEQYYNFNAKEFYDYIKEQIKIDKVSRLLYKRSNGKLKQQLPNDLIRKINLY